MTERRRVPREPDRRTGWERREGRPRELPRCAVEWAMDQLACGRTTADVAEQLCCDRRTLGRRVADYRPLIQDLSVSALRWRCQECYALSLTPKCPNGHTINDAA